MATNLEKQKQAGKIQSWYIRHRLRGRGILQPTPEQITEELKRAETQWAGGRFHRKTSSKKLKQINAFTGEAEEVYDAPKQVYTTEDEPLQFSTVKDPNQAGFQFPDDL